MTTNSVKETVEAELKRRGLTYLDMNRGVMLKFLIETISEELFDLRARVGELEAEAERLRAAGNAAVIRD